MAWGHFSQGRGCGMASGIAVSSSLSQFDPSEDLSLDGVGWGSYTVWLVSDWGLWRCMGIAWHPKRRERKMEKWKRGTRGEGVKGNRKNMKTEVLETLSRKHRLLLLLGFFCWVCIYKYSCVCQLQFLLQSDPRLTVLKGPTAWAGCSTDECSFCLSQCILASALAPEESCFSPDTENLISVHALGLEIKAGHVTVMQCPQLAVSQPGLRASVNPSCHRVTSGASGLQVLLLSAVSCGLSSLQSLLPALVVFLPMLQLGWTSVPKAGSSSRGVPATTALLSPSTPCCSFTKKVWTSQQQGPTLLSCCKYLLEEQSTQGLCSPWGNQALWGGIHWTKHPAPPLSSWKPSAEAGADPQLWLIHQLWVGWSCSGLFWAAQSLFMHSKTLVTSKPEAIPFTPAGLAV